MQHTHIDHGHVLLASDPAGPVVAKDLADRLDLDEHDVQKLIDELVAAGILDRDRVFS